MMEFIGWAACFDPVSAMSGVASYWTLTALDVFDMAGGRRD